MADTERIFAYRLLRIARGDETPLAGFDEKTYADAAGFESHPMPDVVGELVDVRRATISLLRSITPAATTRMGRANDMPVSVRALAWIVAGHAEHHLTVLADRYGVQAS
jgi:hypothetical protein